MQITITTSTGDKVIVSPVLLATSDYVKELVSIYKYDNNNLDINLSEAHNTATLNCYISVLRNESPVISSAEQLVACFMLESLFSDDKFLDYCLLQVYHIWDSFRPLISSLPDERWMYLRTPYEFVPDKYMSVVDFFHQWLSLNRNKTVTLNSNEVYYTKLESYDDDEYGEVDELREEKFQSPKFQSPKYPNRLACYHLINDAREGRIHERGWYHRNHNLPEEISHGLVFGQLEYKANYVREPSVLTTVSNYLLGDKVNHHRHLHKRSHMLIKLDQTEAKLDGCQEAWTIDGQPEYCKNYFDGLAEGLWQVWYSPADQTIDQIVDTKLVLQYRCHYTAGHRDGVYESWHRNGQLHERAVYDAGKYDGIRQSWRADGQPVYSYLYDNGNFIKDLMVEKRQASNDDEDRE